MRCWRETLRSARCASGAPDQMKGPERDTYAFEHMYEILRLSLRYAKKVLRFEVTSRFFSIIISCWQIADIYNNTLKYASNSKLLKIVIPTYFCIFTIDIGFCNRSPLFLRTITDVTWFFNIYVKKLTLPLWLRLLVKTRFRGYLGYTPKRVLTNSRSHRGSISFFTYMFKN